MVTKTLPTNFWKELCMANFTIFKVEFIALATNDRNLLTISNWVEVHLTPSRKLFTAEE